MDNWKLISLGARYLKNYFATKPQFKGFVCLQYLTPLDQHDL